MGARVHYHHPDDEQYTLAFVTTDEAEIQTEGKDTRVERYDFDETVYVLYVDGGASGTIEDDFDDVLEAMSGDDRLFTVRFLQTFEGVIEQREAELTLYKQIELERVPDAIARVDWQAPVAGVAGQLMSMLILVHALPNANHRTSIAMAEWYVESADPSFSLPMLATGSDDWESWVDPYIVESKRLLTVRLNVTPFRLLEQWGCETVVRRGGIEIDLADFDLDMDQSDALAHYAERHTDVCTAFMEESIERTGHEHLLDEQGLDYEGFVEFLDTPR